MKLQQNIGFTLIELLVAVVIIAILAGIAYPSYQNYVLKSNRNGGQMILSQIASQAEQYALQHNGTYPTDLTTAYTGMTPPKSNCYNFSLAANCGANCVTVTATAKGSQAGDKSCRSFSLDSNGNRKATSSTGAVTTKECWGQ